MCSKGKLFCILATLIAYCMVVDANPVKLSGRHPRHAKAQHAIPPPAEQNMFDAPLNQMDAGGSAGDSSSSGESSAEGDVSAEGADVGDYGDGVEPMGNRHNDRAHGGKLPIFGSPNGENPGMEPLKKASTSSSSVGIAFAVLALIGAAVGVSVYVIKRNKLRIPFIKMTNC
ncbi:uncharacterized protein LOC135154112 [Lytechinus pictus]|uniref:uncharacterized protein LOC135154112 n=1 Tax=Lytechinus pictus TaxID=7653 RepID=UPI0030B9E7C7